jgi:hypothetical protein
MHCTFILCTKKTCIFYNSHHLYLLHIDSVILGKKRGVKSVNQVRPVKDMHVKYKQDNLHCMTWYTGTCGSNGHELTIHVSFMVKCVRYVKVVDSLVS